MTYPWLKAPWEQFVARLEQQRLPHALLVSGPSGVGKSALTDIMVAGLLCLEGGPEACGECRSCRLIPGGAHPDLFTVVPEEGKREIQVDPVRRLGERLALTTTISPRKVALLRPAESMNASAANALLKNLEEPPGDTVLILLSHDPSRLPVTIRSRCQSLPVGAPDRSLALDWLRSESGLDETDAGLALEAAGGSPLRAAELVSEGALKRFEALRGELEALVGKPSRTGASAAGLAELDGQLVWTWLSLAAARALTGALGAGERWPLTEHRLPVDKLAALQSKADRYRALLASTVRQDLLLKEWLLEWARLPARESLRQGRRGIGQGV